MKIRASFSFVLIAAVVLITGCDASDNADRVKPIIKNIRTHFVPDSRVNMFVVEVKTGSDSLILRGETTLPEAKTALLDSLTQKDIAVVDSIQVLPSASLDGQIFGLINNSVANIRSAPGHPAQLVTQATLGMPLEILKKDGGWYLVQTPDDYLGWVDSAGLERMDQIAYEEWMNADKLIYLNTYGFSYQKPSASSGKVTDLTAGNIVRLKGRQGRFYEVSYPDGRIGFIAANEAKPLNEWEQNNRASQTSLEQTAKTMMGAPYLWGGTSTKGIDCSGFTKTIFFMNGRIIPRDASQQVHAGKRIDTQKNFDKLKAGDLLFFGRPATDNRPQRVVHVGMWIGDSQFIHSAGRVHISSVDSTAENYDAFNVGRYLEARRYLDNWEGNIIQTSDMYSNLLDRSKN